MNKKFLILLSMLLNFLTFGEVKKNYDCNFLNDFTFNEENNKYIDLYTGKTNMKIKEGITECKVVTGGPFRIINRSFFWKQNDHHYFENAVISLEIKNGRMIRLEVKSVLNNELLFSGKYNYLGLDGEVYMDASVQGSGYSMRLNYKNGKPTGELVEYYNNGKIYRKSMLRNMQIDLSHFSDEFEKYVNSYEIYDYNTGEKIFSENLKNGNGRIISYTPSGKQDKDYEIKNRKIIGGKEVARSPDGKSDSEYYYHKNGKVKKYIQHGSSGARTEYDYDINGKMLRDTHYNKDGEIDNIIDYTKKKR